MHRVWDKYYNSSTVVWSILAVKLGSVNSHSLSLITIHHASYYYAVAA